jgi:hypothetical protein
MSRGEKRVAEYVTERMSKSQSLSDVQLYVRKLGNFARKSKRDVDKAKTRQREEIRALEFTADKLQTKVLEAQSWSPEVARARTLASEWFSPRISVRMKLWSLRQIAS